MLMQVFFWGGWGGGGHQSALWEMWKWWIVALHMQSRLIYFPVHIVLLHLVLIKIVLTRSEQANEGKWKVLGRHSAQSYCTEKQEIYWICLFPRSSYPEFITSAQAIFDSSGGTLSHPDSNVSINVDGGAVPEGMHQRIFFQVVYDDTLLLRDIPKTSGSTLISPVVRCGPENINLLKPVEIVLPHCLCLDETKKDSAKKFFCHAIPTGQTL